MKIVVIGGSGLIGSRLVEKLREAGHDPLPASPDSGVDTVTVSNAPAWDDAAVLDFFETSSRNMSARCFGAELDHHSLTPENNVRIAPTRFEDWLSPSGAMQATPATQGRVS